MSVAIIDIGSARLKVTISIKEGNGYKLIQHKGETHLSSHVSKDNVLDEDFIYSSFTETLKMVNELITKNRCTRTVILGAYVFRTAKNSMKIADYIKGIIGEMTILEEWVEGALFYSKMKKQLNLENFIVVDLGGGSVQLSFGDKPNDVYSIPIGTFTLEKSFQSSKELTTLDEQEKMRSFIVSTFPDLTKKKFEFVVMGSNCMESFTSSALDFANLKSDNISFHDLSVIPLSSLEYIYSAIKDQRYDSLASYYPENPFFMYGADKALLTLIELCRFLSLDKIFPTNESISTSLLDFLHNDSSKLSEYKINVNYNNYNEPFSLLISNPDELKA